MGYNRLFEIPFKRFSIKLNKVGYGITAIKKEYGCTEDDIYNYIRRNVREKEDSYRKVTDQLRKNEEQYKLDKKRKKRKNKGKEKNSFILEVSATNEPITTSEVVDKPEDTATLDSNMIELLSKEKELSEQVMSDEKVYQNKVQEICSNKKELSRITKEVEVLRKNESVKKFLELDARGWNIIDALDASEEERTKLLQVLTKHKRALDSIREEIDKLKKTTILVYSSGEVDIVEGPKIDLNVDGSLDFQNWLIDQPMCQEISIADIKILAKVLAIAKNSGTELDVAFEKEYLEEIFRAFSWEEKS